MLANGTDLNDGVLTAILASQPMQGNINPQADGFSTYQSMKSAKGTDSFTYLVEDGTGLHNLDTVTIQLKKAKNNNKKKGKRQLANPLPSLSSFC